MINTRLIALTILTALTALVMLFLVFGCGGDVIAGDSSDGSLMFYLAPKVLFVIGILRLLFSLSSGLSLFYIFQEFIYSGLLYLLTLISSDYMSVLFGLIASSMFLITTVYIGYRTIKYREIIKW